MKHLMIKDGKILTKEGLPPVYTKRHAYKTYLKDKGIEEDVINLMNTKDMESIVEEIV